VGEGAAKRTEGLQLDATTALSAISLLPLWEKVSAEPTDEGCERRGRKSLALG
jgi:hypothetical protein